MVVLLIEARSESYYFRGYDQQDCTPSHVLILPFDVIFQVINRGIRYIMLRTVTSGATAQ